MHWVSHLPSQGLAETAPDFLRLNRKSATAKVTNPKELARFRKEYHYQEAIRTSGSQTPRELPPAKSLIPSDVIPGFTYGRKSRPSTPIQEVISNRFGEKHEIAALRFNEQFQEQRATQAAEVRKIPLTRASRGHASTAKKAALQSVDNNKELYKLSKFLRVKPQVDTGLRKTPRYQFSEEPGNPSWGPPPATPQLLYGPEYQQPRDTNDAQESQPVQEAQTA